MNDLDARLDELILSFARMNWLKTARVIADVLHWCEDTAFPASDQQIFERLVVLRDRGALESQGNLARWRFSEVRLPPGSASEYRGKRA